MPHKNVFNEDALLKSLAAPVNYNEQALNLGFSGTGEGVRIAVISSGVPDHAAIKGVGRGISFSDSSTLDDAIGQATIVSGIMAADEPLMMVGVAPKASLMYAKVANDDGKIAAESVISSILWGIIKKVDIIVLPVTIDVDFPAMEGAIKKAASSNIAVVCSAGTRGYPQYPAEYEETLSVGVLNHSGELADYSATGDINVIGTSMPSTHVRQYYVIASGGTCSAGFGAGLLALLMAEKGVKMPPVADLYVELADRLKR
jgi:hypothetical protein